MILLVLVVAAVKSIPHTPSVAHSLVKQMSLLRPFQHLAACPATPAASGWEMTRLACAADTRNLTEYSPDPFFCRWLAPEILEGRPSNAGSVRGRAAWAVLPWWLPGAVCRALLHGCCCSFALASINASAAFWPTLACRPPKMLLTPLPAWPAAGRLLFWGDHVGVRGAPPALGRPDHLAGAAL